MGIELLGKEISKVILADEKGDVGGLFSALPICAGLRPGQLSPQGRARLVLELPFILRLVWEFPRPAGAWPSVHRGTSAAPTSQRSGAQESHQAPYPGAGQQRPPPGCH